MADQLAQTVEGIRAKCLVLSERYLRLAHERQQANARVEILERELAASKAEVERLSAELRSLRMSSVIKPDKADRKNFRDLLSGLVREIDRCIIDLGR